MTQALNKKSLQQVVAYFLDKGQDRIAIEQGQRACSYAELTARVNSLCAALRALGVERGDVVALPMPASIDYVVALLAVVQAGAIFMPLDPTFPETRLRKIMAQAAPCAVVGIDPEIVAHIADLAGGVDTLLLSSDPVAAAERLPGFAGDDDTGYLIHTSGSTGEPKMIAGRNKGISHFVHWEVAEFGIKESVRASFFAPPTFDVSLREIFVPLLAGGTLVIPDPAVRSDARRLVGWLREQRISLMHCVPSLFRLLTRALADDRAHGLLPDLRIAALAGEPLYGADVSAWRAAAGDGTQLVNLYGPSETTLAKAFHRIDGELAPTAVVPLGQPISNTALLILRDGRLCEIGEIGELHISTPFASNGYYGDAELTAKAFVPNPLAPADSPERIYRTGDLGRYRKDRSVEFVGRADRQVKVNGVRIELPEIEGAMRGHPAVTEAVAHTFRLADGENILVGYYTAAEPLDPQAVRAALQAGLPDNMLPAYLLQLDAFPRNLNGKIDRKALPRPESMLEQDHGYTAPQDELEDEIAKLWANALGLARVGVTSPYLQIGGNSLRAIGLIGRIGQRFGAEISIRDFFESGTVRALAARIRANQTPGRQALPRAAEQEHYPLTDAQAGLWILDRIDSARTLYNNVEWLELHGPLNSDALQAAFRMLVERHEALRTAFIEVDGEPRQRILETAQFGWEIESAGAAHADGRVREMLRQERARLFDLTAGELLHVRLLRQTPDLHHLIINMHHIACDGWSMGLLVKELTAGYLAIVAGADSVLFKGTLEGTEARSAATPTAAQPPRRMRDLACWLAADPNPETTARRAEEWRTKLADADNRAAIPPDHATEKNVDRLLAGQTHIDIGGEPAAALRRQLAEQGATPFMAIAAALSILLYRYGGSETIIIGTPLAGRARSEMTEVVGFMVNTLPLVLRLSPDLSFAALLDRTRHAVQALAESEDDAPAKLIGSRAAADPTRNPFFDVVLAMEPAPASMSLDGLQVIEREVPDAPARNDLSLRLQDDGATLRLTLEYRQALYRHASMAELLAQLNRLLNTGLANPTQPLRRLPMLSPAQNDALLRLAHGPSQPLPHTTIHQAFAEQALRTADAIALIGFDDKISYRSLERRANRIAVALHDDYAVRPGDVVAVLLERETDWPAAILGILKAGGIYLPLDSWHPSARHAELIEDAGARVLIARGVAGQEPVAGRLPFPLPASAGGTELGCAVLDLNGLPGHADAPPHISVQPDAPAYLIYTSGSTGTPKGVLVSHRAFLNMIVDQIKALGTNGSDTVLQFVSPAFDVSVFEVFLALLSGARLALAERRLCNTAQGFADAIARLHVTVAAMTPGFLNSLGDLPLAGLRMIISGGEAPIAADMQRRLAQGIRYVNAYGPTEAAVCAAFYEIDPGRPLPEPVPIGRPTANTTLHVVAPDLSPLPPGAIGELAIAGAGLALEYYRRPSATEQAFVSGTLAAGDERLYRTGDRVRRLADGSLVFVGRADGQVKIRGHRVETGEIEAILRRQAGVRDARILPRAVGQDMELVAYWVGDEAAAAGLRQALTQRLPEYMVPRLMLRLDALPLNANGKLDRSRLPAAEIAVAQIDTAYDAPRNPDEMQLAALWSELLGSERVGRDDDFFDFGGRSLAANRLALRAARALGVPVDLRDIYAAPTPAALAHRLRSRTLPQQAALPLLAPDQPAPLSPMQRRLWVIDQLGESGSAYHICGLTRLHGALNVDALRAAFDDLIERHAVLRTRFVSEQGEPSQVTDAAGPAPWISLPQGLSSSDLRAQLEEIGNQTFDLSLDWPIRIALAADGNAGSWQLLVVLHHIAADGWSMPILEAELSQAYAARLRGAAPAWTPLPAQYRDVSAWLEQQLRADAFAADRAYWLQQLEGPLPLLDLPSDRPRPAVRRFQGMSLDCTLQESTVKAARACAEQHGVTLFTVLLAGLQTLFYRLSGQDDLIIGVPVAGRQHPASEGLIGFFVNTLALRERIVGEQGFAQRLKAAAETMRQGLFHQNYPFDRLVGELNIARDTSRSALFDVMIGLDEAVAEPLLPGLIAETLPLARNGSRCDMSWMFDFGSATPALRVEFDTDLFDPARVEDWVRRFEHLLGAAVREPLRALDRLDLLLENEREKLLQHAVAPTPHLPESTVVQLFEAQAAAHENATALISDGGTWTYGELNKAANRLARKLQRTRGGHPSNAPIALLAQRGPLMVVAQLAIQKCGAAYLPIEPDAPQERVALLLDDSRAALLLCEPGIAPPAGGMQPAPDSGSNGADCTSPMVLPLTIPDENEEDGTDLPSSVKPSDPIYVMYTSGSTGRPKGVVALHHGVVRLVRQSGYYTPEPNDRILQLSNYAFDGATFDFYAALTNGLTLCLPDQDTLLDPQALAAFVERHQVNVSFITTALFNRVVDETPQLLCRFRQLYFGGQECSLPHVRRALQHMTPGALVHVYGPTETTTFATWHTVDAADLGEHAVRLPIGRPINHTSTYLLDQHQMPVPAGLPGELYIGGKGLAQGYLGQPEMTAERFIPSPLQHNERLYRTGDLCVQRPDGAIEFLGRLDGQVKVRGFRIELGEIEHHLLSHPAVEKVHVMPRRTASGNTELVAYLTGRAGQAQPSLQALLDHLEKALPRYMLPAHFVLLDAMPVNRNGKVDRNALPAPEGRAMSLEQSAAANADASADHATADRETVLLDTWKAVLGRDAIGLHDNYFALGGDSIQAIQIVSRLRTQGFALKVTDLLRYPSIAQLAPLLGSGAAQKPRAKQSEGDIALTPIQSWMLERQLPAPNHFNQSVLLELPAASDAARVMRALAALQAQHDALRLRFGIGADGKPWQRLAPAGATWELPEHVLHGPDAEATMLAEINRIQRSLAPETGPIWRAALFHLPQGDRLLLTIHHWAVDGVSWRIILEDLSAAYEQAANPQAAIRLPAASQSYRDWSHALAEAAAGPHFGSQLAYWRKQMTSDIGTLPRAADVQAATLSERMVLEFSLPQAQSDALFGTCHEAYRTRSDELLLSAWVHALTQVQGHPSCRIVLESHGRETLSDTIDVSRTVGWFTAIYPLAFALDGDGWSNRIRQVKETLRGVPDHGIGYGLLRYLGHAADLQGVTGEVVFNYLGRFDHREQALPAAQESTGDELDPAIRLEQGLDVSAEVRDGMLRVRLVGDAKRYQAACFHALHAAFEQALHDLIAHCQSADAGGLSPSDVDLQGLGIGDLDNILDSLEGL